MKNLFLCLGLAAAMFVCSDAKGQVTLYDNLDAGGNLSTSVFFGGGPGFPDSRRLVGDVFSAGPTLPSGSTDFRVETVSFDFLTFANPTTPLGGTLTGIQNAFVRVDFFSDVTGGTGGELAGNFSNNLIASHQFELGNTNDGNGNFGGFVIVDGATDTQDESLDFSGLDVRLGDAQDVAVSFRFFAGVPGATDESELLTIAYRNSLDGGPGVAPLVGTSTTTNFRDENLNDFIDGTDNFGFGSGAQLAFSITAVAVPEPSSALILVLSGVGFALRRRR